MPYLKPIMLKTVNCHQNDLMCISPVRKKLLINGNVFDLMAS